MGGLLGGCWALDSGFRRNDGREGGNEDVWGAGRVLGGVWGGGPGGVLAGVCWGRVGGHQSVWHGLIRGGAFP